MEQRQELAFLGDYFQGQFILAADPDGEWEILSPGDLRDKVTQASFSYDHIDSACLSARAAYLDWARLGVEGRRPYLQRLKEMYSVHSEELAELISRETGKPLWESRTEAKAMISKIDITLNHSLKLVAEERVENALPGVDGYIRHKPRGVMAVVGPFNFPGHLANGHIIPALIAGNTVVFKPSDKAPMVGQWMARMFDQAEFPPGVFNLLQGKAETGKRLCVNHYVDGILFTGSYEVGLKIQQDTLHHHWKILALEMGGKNSTIIWEDADLDKAIYETLIGAFLTTGQRCSCTSKVIVHEKIADEFTERFYQAAKKIAIGHWTDAKVFMGPLISSEAVEKYLRFQEIAKREGAESLMRGKVLDLPVEGHYVTPSINLVDKFDPKSVYQKSEIFGPNVAIQKVSDFDEALTITNSTGFGLVMALFSKDRSLYEKALIEARVGLLNWNRTTNGASSRLPFGGMGKSGNDRPSAHYAIQYCTVPVASLEDGTPFNPEQSFPGLEFEPQS